MNWADHGGVSVSPALAVLLLGLAALAVWQLCRRLPVQQLPYGVYEKRRSPRLAGVHVSLCLADVDGHAKPYNARVLDYSREGLCLAVNEALTVGDIIRVRLAWALDSDAWVAVWVRHCRRLADHWEVGCRNLQPASLLLERLADGDQTP